MKNRIVNHGPLRTAALAAIGFLILSTGPTLRCQEATLAKPVDEQKMNFKFPIDEKMVYKVKAFGISLATQTNTTRGIAEKGGRSAVNIFSAIKTNRWVVMYGIDNSMETFIDAETLNPLHYEERANEKDWAAVEIVNFFPDRMKFNFKKGLKLDREGSGEFEYGPGGWPQDELSMIYYVRHLDLKEGKTFTVPACVDNALETATIKVVKKQQLKTIHGKKDVFYVTSTLGDSKFYVGADERRIPYGFEVTLNFGTIKATLVEYSPE
ncbi:MAG: DUF3108 domain-containing protein [bacterium]